MSNDIISRPNLDFDWNGYYAHKHSCSNCWKTTAFAIKKGTTIPRKMMCDNCEVIT